MTTTTNAIVKGARHRVARHLSCLLMALCLPLLPGCVSGIPQTGRMGEEPAARALLEASAQAHGLEAYRQLRDLNVSYEGEWRFLVQKLQPVLVDPSYRKSSQERLLLGAEPMMGQRHTGPAGIKQVTRSATAVEVRFNDKPSTDRDALAAAALVADAYRMFILGPMHFLTGNATLEQAGTEDVEGRPCDVLLVVRKPGHGLSTQDHYMLFIDRQDRVLRRVRFTLEGLDSTKGAVVEVDFFDHRRIAGVLWPTRFFERIRKPVPMLSAHAWKLTGLDVNRGYVAADISGPDFTGLANRAADPIK